jgi:hypothetical protein
VFLWFAGLSVVAVWSVFRDPAFDYRLVVVGALLPDLLDAPFGGARWMHTLLVSVLVLMAVMLTTRNRRGLRRHLLAIPIGMLLHLVLDGMWTETEVFWWPLLGPFEDTPLPVTERGWLLVPMEIAGLAALIWCWSRFGLDDQGRRRLLLRTGRFDRTVAAQGPDGAAAC